MMTTMVAEIYDALMAAGVPPDTARKAAEASAKVETQMVDVAGRMDRLGGRIDLITWMLGANLTVTMFVLGKLLLLH
jgi:hypothetical protein